jgi:dephospho-CoA kinase
LRELGVPVVDADQAARQIVAPGQPALQALVAAFGVEILDAAGALDRAAMRDRIIADSTAKKTLESITHPAIRHNIAMALAGVAQAGHAAAVVEAALLIESGGYKLYADLIVVSTDPDQQFKRVMARDGQTEEQARGIIAAQMSMADKEKLATYIIRNDGDLAQLRKSTLAVWNAIRP